ncbi:lipoate- ligase a [Fusarium sporotrichioides]|uniref:Putative lipoate-protein ligase A n=1 Tax=Fusarium sporotrichioides TaxID=5514 RepID=A0A395SSJ1_FUSSP|nr:lipoate- ligase a [Fusarium sporotrichioides]
MMLLKRPLQNSTPRAISRLIPSTSTIPRRQFTDAAAHSSNKIQVYTSKSRDPFLNLSVEHYLLQKTPPESTILFLYTNDPCIVFGRNQNPWMEVNLPRLDKFRNDPASVGWTGGPVQLVRRRSGGGAVFHDEGNVNFSVICPPAVFDRNKHAEMVVRALSSLGKPNTRVNERHDIVMDIPNDPIGTYKISGSAYKLTRLRSLHHGTCLLRSPNLNNISGMLRSPAEPFIKTRGVDSVRSPVRNVGIENAAFEGAVLDEFARMYGDAQVREEISDQVRELDIIGKGYNELQSRDWIYGQTPRFTFSSYPYTEDPRERPQLDFDTKLRFDARHGVVENFTAQGASSATEEGDLSTLASSSIYDVPSWSAQLSQAGMSDTEAAKVGTWMDNVLGVEFTKPTQ